MASSSAMNLTEIDENENKFEVPTWREILKRIPNARKDWAQKKPLQKFGYLYGIGKMGADATAYAIFRDDQTLTPYSYFTVVVSAIHNILMFYTLYWYAVKGMFAKGVPCTVFVMGANLTTYTFLLPTLSKQRYLMHDLVAFGARYIYRDQHDDIEYQRICSKAMDQSMKQFLTKMLMMIFGFTLALIGPTIAFAINGIKTTTVELSYPFVEEKSWTEFALNILYQNYYAIHGGLLYVGGEVAMAIFSNMVTISPNLIGHKLNQLIWNHVKNRISPSQLRYTFMDFVQQCVDANGYVRNVAFLLSWRSLITPLAFCYAIGMSIYCQYMLGYSAGYGMAIMMWIQFFYICELGENISDNGFVEMLYGCDWYLLPIKNQKAISLLINLQQNAPGLSIGPFAADLNREVFKIVTNKIYSFVMFLMNFN